MSDAKTMVRTSISIGDVSFMLAQGEDAEDLKRQVETAVQTDGAFVEFVTVGNRAVSVLVTGRDRVIVSVETVLFDDRDTGNVDAPFGSLYDMI